MLWISDFQAKDLKAEDLNGSSDPVVEIAAFGQKRTTKVHHNCTTCVFDETFVIMLNDIKPHELEQGTIKVLPGGTSALHPRGDCWVVCCLVEVLLVWCAASAVLPVLGVRLEQGDAEHADWRFPVRRLHRVPERRPRVLPTGWRGWGTLLSRASDNPSTLTTLTATPCYWSHCHLGHRNREYLS